MQGLFFGTLVSEGVVPDYLTKNLVFHNKMYSPF